MGDYPIANGGAIYCDGSSSPTIAGNIISGNTANDFGGGIYCTNSSIHSEWFDEPIIMDNRITGNNADFGGGIYCILNTPIIEGNEIIGNTSNLDGAGIYCFEADAHIENNTIMNNTADQFGGGMFGVGASPIITGNVIMNNYAGEWAGGIGFYNESVPEIIDNVISGNTAVEKGGGIFLEYNDSYPPVGQTVVGNTICYNDASYGGGIHMKRYSITTIEGNTITGNLASIAGGGIYCEDHSNPTVNNTILWDNDAPSGDEIYFDIFSMITVTYSDVQGSWGGEGNKDEDPLFIDPDNDDYHLLADSPCIDAGDPTYDVPSGGGCRIDMGAYEYWKGFNCWKNKTPVQLR
jgi:predicted outer membrane repeat protein